MLDNIFKDAGVAHQGNAAEPVNSLEPTPSHATWPAPKSGKSTKRASKSKAHHSAPSNDMVGLSGSSFDVLSQRLLNPTQEQERDQLFSLSAEQYNGVTSSDFLQDIPTAEPSRLGRNAHSHGTEQSSGRGRASQPTGTDKSSMAEVYTRSLMWDRVPADVVRDFARFVANSEALARQTKVEQDAA